MLTLKIANNCLILQCDANVIEPFKQAVSTKVLSLKGNRFAIGRFDNLLLKIDNQTKAFGFIHLSK